MRLKGLREVRRRVKPSSTRIKALISMRYEVTANLIMRFEIETFPKVAFTRATFSCENRQFVFFLYEIAYVT